MVNNIIVYSPVMWVVCKPLFIYSLKSGVIFTLDGDVNLYFVTSQWANQETSQHGYLERRREGKEKREDRRGEGEVGEGKGRERGKVGEGEGRWERWERGRDGGRAPGERPVYTALTECKAGGSCRPASPQRHSQPRLPLCQQPP